MHHRLNTGQRATQAKTSSVPLQGFCIPHPWLFPVMLLKKTVYNAYIIILSYIFGETRAKESAVQHAVQHGRSSRGRSSRGRSSRGRSSHGRQATEVKPRKTSHERQATEVKPRKSSHGSQATEVKVYNPVSLYAAAKNAMGFPPIAITS